MKAGWGEGRSRGRGAAGVVRERMVAKARVEAGKGGVKDAEGEGASLLDGLVGRGGVRRGAHPWVQFSD